MKINNKEFKDWTEGDLQEIVENDAFRENDYLDYKELLAECEAWAKRNGCHEFASDCEIDNIGSFRFHKAMNFAEVNRIICFTKRL